MINGVLIKIIKTLSDTSVDLALPSAQRLRGGGVPSIVLVTFKLKVF